MTVEVTQLARQIYADYMEIIATEKGDTLVAGQREKCLSGEMDQHHGVRIAIEATRAAAERIAELEGALEPFVSGACHTMVFLQSREKMHSCGIDLYREDVERARAALQHKEPKP